MNFKRHAKWVNFFEIFPYVIHYRIDVVANALSRRYATKFIVFPVSRRKNTHNYLVYLMV